MSNDIVLDTNVARLYDHAGDPRYKKLFQWLHGVGCLTVSKSLLQEYAGTKNHVLAGLIRRLVDSNRLSHVKSRDIRLFADDRHYNYTCNPEDISHARLVFLSHRKYFVGYDNPLIADINAYHRINGKKPSAWRYPPDNIYVHADGLPWP